MAPLIATEKALSLSKMSLNGKYRLKVDLFIFFALFFWCFSGPSVISQKDISSLRRAFTEGFLSSEKLSSSLFSLSPLFTSLSRTPTTLFSVEVRYMPVSQRLVLQQNTMPSSQALLGKRRRSSYLCLF